MSWAIPHVPSTIENPAPVVSCVVVAHDHERYVGRAIDSVLGQDYPSSSLEVIVLDDGSTDATAEVVGSYGDRVRLIRQDNQGHIAAYSNALEAVTGAYVALLDGDDEWLPHKVRRQVELLEARPGLGLVHADEEVIDQDGNVIEPSFWQAHAADMRDGRGPVLGRLMRGNFVKTSTLMFRAELLDRVLPIPAWARAQDWWIAFRVAQVADIEAMHHVCGRYRRHGANLWFGATEAVRTRHQRREIPLRRWMLAGAQPGDVPLSDLVNGFAGLELTLNAVGAATGESLEQLAPVDEAARDRSLEATEAARAALERGDLELAMVRAVNALADAPGDPEARALLERAVRRANGQEEPSEQATPVAAERPEVLDDARSVVVVSFADELVRDPLGLAAYCAAIDEADDVTLVLYAPGRSEPALLNAVTNALAAVGVDAGSGPDMLAVAGSGPAVERTIAERADAIYSRRPVPPAFAGLPIFAPSDLAELRSLAGPPARRPSAGPVVPVVMCVWKRPEFLPATLALLERQVGVQPQLHLWINDPDVAEQCRRVAATASFPVELTVSERNVGGFGRFHLARELAGEHEYVVFIDDDQTFDADALRCLLEEARPRTISAQYGFQLLCPHSYWRRRRPRPGDWIQYAGTGGMIADTAIFREERLFRCPPDFHFVEDLWLSYVAQHELGWRLQRSAAGFVQVPDGRDQWATMPIELKSEFLRELAGRGWQVPAHSPSPDAEPWPEPAGSGCSCAAAA
jgi:Glycosyl transferase family 2